jgi:hypothetical protein
MQNSKASIIAAMFLLIGLFLMYISKCKNQTEIASIGMWFVGISVGINIVLILW